MACQILRHPVLERALAERLSARLPAPLAIVAMGSPWRGDDAAALVVADLLAPRRPRRLFNVETAPESFLVPISRSGAASCVLMDAVDADAEPGDVVLLEPGDLEHTDVTTHGLSPKAFLQALGELGRMTIVVLGIQGGPNRQGEELSPPVERAARTVAQALAALLEREVGGGADEQVTRPGRRGKLDADRA